MATTNNNQNTEKGVPKIEETAILEYLDIVKNEYETERNKKQSLENRAGLIMALLGAICIFLFEKVKLNDIFSLATLPLNFLILTKILSGLTVYAGLLFTMIMIIKTIAVNKHHNFEVKSINDYLLGENRLTAVCKIIFTYRDIIIQHRELNEKRAKTLRRALYGISLTFVSFIIYLSIPL